MCPRTRTRAWRRFPALVETHSAKVCGEQALGLAVVAIPSCPVIHHACLVPIAWPIWVPAASLAHAVRGVRVRVVRVRVVRVRSVRVRKVCVRRRIRTRCHASASTGIPVPIPLRGELALRQSILALPGVTTGGPLVVVCGPRLAKSIPLLLGPAGAIGGVEGCISARLADATNAAIMRGVTVSAHPCEHP